MELEQFVLAINAVEPGLIRVEDEQALIERLLEQGFATIGLRPHCAGVRVMERCAAHGDARVFFLFNEGRSRFDGTVILPATGEFSVEEWDAVTGLVYGIDRVEHVSGGAAIRLSLPPGASRSTSEA